jgi:deaminated glutathione amidase
VIVDPLGDVVADTAAGSADEPVVVTGIVERSVLAEARRTNPSLANRRL